MVQLLSYSQTQKLPLPVIHDVPQLYLTLLFFKSIIFVCFYKIPDFSKAGRTNFEGTLRIWTLSCVLHLSLYKAVTNLWSKMMSQNLVR